jgi:hypothetical protein
VTQTRTLLLILSLLAAPPTFALAHEKGVLRLGSKEVRTGGELDIRGEKLPKAATVRLELRGTLETFPLSQVRTSAAGRFDAKLALPPEARAGSYTVVAVASDGDIVARTELTVIAAASGAAMEDMAGHSGANVAPATSAGPRATAEIMRVPVSTTGAEWVTIIGIITLSLVGGLILLRSASAHRP